MASTAITEAPSPLVGQNVFLSFGTAYLDSSHKKTHAVAQVFFNMSFTKAYLYYTKDDIQSNWPSNISDSYSSTPLDFSKLAPEGFINWFQISYPSNTNVSPEYYSMVSTYLDKCCATVQKVKVTFDSEKTYKNSLLQETAVDNCKRFFPNLRSYSLSFSSW